MEAAKGGHTAGLERVGSNEGRHARGPGLGEFLPPGPRGCMCGVSAPGPPLKVSFFHAGNAAVEPNEASSWLRNACAHAQESHGQPARGCPLPALGAAAMECGPRLLGPESRWGAGVCAGLSQCARPWVWEGAGQGVPSRGLVTVCVGG